MALHPISTGSPRKPRNAEPWPRGWRAAGACALAFLLTAAAAAADPKLLPPEQAFRFSARALDARTLEARFNVADGYYLYRDKLKFAVDPNPAQLTGQELPPGKAKDDPFFGKVETYRGVVIVRLPVANVNAGQSIALSADSQGCADAGVCYPPTRQKITLVLPANGKGPGPLVDSTPAKKLWFD
jgi:thiol:disulfide interchange protein DsbD